MVPFRGIANAPGGGGKGLGKKFDLQKTGVRGLMAAILGGSAWARWGGGPFRGDRRGPGGGGESPGE